MRVLGLRMRVLGLRMRVLGLRMREVRELLPELELNSIIRREASFLCSFATWSLCRMPALCSSIFISW